MKKFNRKPLEVEAIRYTRYNTEELKEICKRIYVCSDLYSQMENSKTLLLYLGEVENPPTEELYTTTNIKHLVPSNWLIKEPSGRWDAITEWEFETNFDV